MVEDVQGPVRWGVKLERVAGLGVDDRDHDLVVGLVPQQSNFDSVALAAVELSDLLRGLRMQGR